METINSAGKMVLLIDLIQKIHKVDQKTPSAPSLYINLEGTDVHRNGFISLITLLLDTGAPTPLVIHLDMFKLGTEAFNTPSTEGKSSKEILQDKEITKVFLDVCNGSDALFAQYGVALQGVQDIPASAERYQALITWRTCENASKTTYRLGTRPIEQRAAASGGKRLKQESVCARRRNRDRPGYF